MNTCSICNSTIENKQNFCLKCGAKFPLDLSIIAQIDILKKMIDKNPLDTGSYIKLGDLYNENNIIELALEQYYKAATIDSNNPEIYFKLGKCQISFDKKNDAAKSLEKAYELDKKNKNIQKELALIYSAINEWDKSIEYCKMYLKSETDFEISMTLVKIYKEKGEINETIKVLNELIKKGVENQEVLNELSNLYELNADFIKLADINEKIWKQNSTEENFLALKKAYIYNSDPDKTLNLKNDNKKINNVNYSNFLNMLALIMIREIRNAINLFETINVAELDLKKIEINHFINIIKNNADIKSSQNAFDDSIQLLLIANKIDPENITIKEELAKQYYNVGEEYKLNTEFDKALEYFNQSVNYGNEKAKHNIAEIYALKGEIFLTKNKFKEAYSSYKLSQNNEPDNLDYKKKLENIHENLTKHNKRKSFAITFSLIAILFIVLALWFINYGRINIICKPARIDISLFKIITQIQVCFF